MSRTSPTQRSLALARERSWEAAVVEKWVTVPGMPGGGVRKDLGGFGDVLCWKPPVWTEAPHDAGWKIQTDGGILAVQACSGSGLAAHRTKLLAEPRLRSWLLSGGRCAIWAWRKVVVVKKDGRKGKARRWACLEEELTLEQFERPQPSTTNLDGNPEPTRAAGGVSHA